MHLSVGKMLDAAEQAATFLESEGVSVTVWDARVVTPLDPAMIEDAAAHRLVITAEDGLKAGGVGESMRSAIDEINTMCRVGVIGIPTEYIAHGKPDAILARLGLDCDGVVAMYRKLSS